MKIKDPLVEAFHLNLDCVGKSEWHNTTIENKTIGNYTFIKEDPCGQEKYETIKFVFLNQVGKYADSIKENIMESFVMELINRQKRDFKNNKKFMFEAEGLRYWAKVDSSKQLISIDVFRSNSTCVERTELSGDRKESYGCYKYLFNIRDTKYSLFEMTTDGFSAFELVNPFELIMWLMMLVTSMQDVMRNGNFMTEMKFKNLYLDGYGHPYIVVHLEIMNDHDILMSFS